MSFESFYETYKYFGTPNLFKPAGARVYCSLVPRPFISWAIKESGNKTRSTVEVDGPPCATLH